MVTSASTSIRGSGCDLLDCPFEHRLVGSRWPVSPRDLANVLLSGGVDLFVGGRRVEIMEGSDAAAHGPGGYRAPMSRLLETGERLRLVAAGHDQQALVIPGYSQGYEGRYFHP